MAHAIVCAEPRLTACMYTVAEEGSKMASLVRRPSRAWRTLGMRPEVSRPAERRQNQELISGDEWAARSSCVAYWG